MLKRICWLVYCAGLVDKCAGAQHSRWCGYTILIDRIAERKSFTKGSYNRDFTPSSSQKADGGGKGGGVETGKEIQ